ncbi:helix-turn-helix domain-containing protein [Zobellia barbeyronii]|uniref:Helix-turn-helix domain-containing protein n=1 Tax=Zobellia barbeyronii TaxID=2748009 RepID=A0ABS5WBX6_9FLAO|nr:helix-turn-helix domain-containing protein [Zobellia barbeyronii]MBT2160550.1 helix-turn-helix domain-containing protein [Zobellia barbeyronii]
MSKNNIHPGLILNKALEDKGLSQKELASKINVAHSLLNNILKGKRNINVNIAISLEAAGLNNATYWMSKHMEYLLYQAKNDSVVNKKKEAIETWDIIERESLIPLEYFKKHVDVNSSDDLQNIFDIYKVKNIQELKGVLDNYSLTYFRKSTKFAESRNNVIAWSLLAEMKANEMEVKTFDKSTEKTLIKELKNCFRKNQNTVKNTKKILANHGIKFDVLDRPQKTPVEGKSFISGNNPAIFLSLKYKRLDNFAFTIMHELGHVYKHLTKSKYRRASFFINNANMKLEEFEADNYAQNNLIKLDIWNEFYMSNEEFDDALIIDFANELNIHPGIVRGRICFENPEYYRKRTIINRMNVLS